MAVIVFLVSAYGMTALAQKPAKASVETRTVALERILADYRDEQSKREPERTSLTGDKRYADQLTDLSASAENDRVERGQTYIQRLSAVDTAGLPEKTRSAAENLLNMIIEEQSGDRPKPWQRPLDQFTSMNALLLELAQKLPFATVKDYDDYIARLGKIPYALSQIMTNVLAGADAGRHLPQADVEKALALVKSVVEHPAETSPFAAPLKRFPPSIPAADRQRLSADLLDAIATSVTPSYQRLARFVATHASSTPAP